MLCELISKMNNNCNQTYVIFSDHSASNGSQMLYLLLVSHDCLMNPAMITVLTNRVGGQLMGKALFRSPLV